MTKFIVADGNAVYGIGDTPEAAYADAAQYAEFPAFDDLPRRAQSDGSAYIGRASEALCDLIMTSRPDCSRVSIDGIEYTETEADEIESQ